MRVALAIASLILAGCANNGGSLEAEYRHSRSLLQSEQYSLALGEVDTALRKIKGHADARELWRFRLLQAEVLLADRRVSEAGAILGSDLPEGPDWAEYRARALLIKGTTAYFLTHYSEAQDLLARAALLAQETGSASLATEVSLRQANLMVSQGRFDTAETQLRQVIHSASDLHDTSLEATATGSLGYMLLN